MTVSKQELKKKEIELRQKLSFFILILMVLSLTVCNTPSRNQVNKDPRLTLVNPANRIPDYWEQRVEFASGRNAMGEEVIAEKETLTQFESLKEALEAEGIGIDINNAWRSYEDQKAVWEEAQKLYGEDAGKHASKPGYSEYETGYAIDFLVMKDGKAIRPGEELLAEQEVLNTIHSHLPAYGFIVRILPGKEEICGGLEALPWHIRYVGPEAAQAIADQGIVLEEYLSQKQ